MGDERTAAMTEPIDLEMALYRMLHHRSYRQAFLAGRYEELQLGAEQIRYLQAIDRTELVATAKRIGRNLLMGDVVGASGGLSRVYPRVLQTLQAAGANVQDVIERFMESESFERYREVSYAGEGICVEEAFAHFLRQDERFAAGSVNGYLLTHEFLNTLLAILVINRDPSFVIDTRELQSNGTCFYALQRMPQSVAEWLSNRKLSSHPDDEVIWLYAAAATRFISGPISPFVAEVLAFGSKEELQQAQADLANRYGLTEEQWQTHLQKLGEMGLLAMQAYEENEKNSHSADA